MVAVDSVTGVSHTARQFEGTAKRHGGPRLSAVSNLSFAHSVSSWAGIHPPVLRAREKM